jgi:predicted dehydrogenase
LLGLTDCTVLDSVQFAIGDVTNIKSTRQLQRPNVPIEHRQTKETIETVKSDVPDLVIATGTLDASPIAQEGATLYFRLRRGQSFLNEPPLVWTINGEKGEIRLVSPGGTALQATAYYKPVVIEIHDHTTDQVEQIEWDWADWQKELPIVGRNTGALYDAFANDDPYPTFEDALRRHEQLEEIMAN